MIKKLPFYVFLFICFTSFGQRQAISLSFQKIAVGHGIEGRYNFSFNENWLLSPGIYVHFNALPSDDQSFAFKNRGWANSTLEHFGLSVALNRSILKYRSVSEIFIFFDSRALYQSNRTSVYSIVGMNNGRVLYTKIDGYISDPFLNWENSLGIQFSAHISEKFFISLRGGLGISFNYPPKNFLGGNTTKLLGTYSWEGMSMFSLGVGYLLK